MTLMYLIFGNIPYHHSQAYFSICSFLSQLDQTDRIYVFTDAPDFYKKLEQKINILTLDQEKINDWKGPYQFFWRIKIKAIQYLCTLYPQEPVLYLDTDTFLFGDLKKLKEKLKNPIMHLKEGELKNLKSKTEKLMWQQTNRQIFGGILIDHAMWNAGVVGLPAQKGEKTLDLALQICDQMLEKKVTPRLIEQFALSVALSENGNLTPASEYIAHYWSAKEEWNFEIQTLMFDSFLRNTTLEEDLQKISQLDVKKNPIYQKIPNTQKRLIQWIKKIFPTKNQTFI